MTTTAEQTTTSIYELRCRIAEALGVGVESVAVSVSATTGEWTEVEATIQLWNQSIGTATR